MTAVFVDTSAFYAELDGTDPNHEQTKAAFGRSRAEGWRLVTTNYVVHESWAVIQVRLGWEAVEVWRDRLVAHCEIVWITQQLHELGEARCRQARQRHLSLTDCVSIEVMHRRGIRHALAFDEHFVREGFSLPGAADVG